MGIFIDGLLGNFDSSPPVHYPADGSAPGVGYPVVIEHDGKVSIPILGEVHVAKLTISEARKKITEACTGGKDPLLRSGTRNHCKSDPAR